MNDGTIHYRKHIRLSGLEYRESEAYFITICTGNRECVFREVVGDSVRRSQRGLVVERCWADIPNHHSFVELDAFVVMPNHVHGILCFVGDVAATPASPLRGDAGVAATRRAHGPKSGSLGSVVGSFKSAVTRSINRMRPGTADRLWQQNYYEHVIRSERAHEAIRDYILTNPQRWEMDQENPLGTGEDRVEAFLDHMNDGVEVRRGDAGVAATGEK